jgi:DNA topoisomerase-1
MLVIANFNQNQRQFFSLNEKSRQYKFIFLMPFIQSNRAGLRELEKYTLIITEKPDAALRLASALDITGKANRIVEKGVPRYEAYRGKKIVIVPALGHLYTISTSTKGHGQYPVFDYSWVPKYKAERKATRIRIWLQTIEKLAKEAEDFIDACDYDIEGSIIGYCILKYACGGKEKVAKRMKYSTLTKEELEKSYDTLLPHLDFSIIEAGLARHEVDWLYGINLSRALTSAAKNWSNHYTTLSTGRVQGPTLKFLAMREKSIECFVPAPYWTIKARIKIGDSIFDANYEKKTLETKDEADRLKENCKKKSGEIEKVEIKKFQVMPPFPFDLGSLQGEAYRIFGYTPARTLFIAQRLYLDALISYPRTNSQKLPPEIGYKKILENLAKNRDNTLLAGELLTKKELKPTEGKKQDPAHPAIFPTGKPPGKNLLSTEKNIYRLIVSRFLAVFGNPISKQATKALVNVNGEKFTLNGSQTLEEGWLHFYTPFGRFQESPLPPIKEGDKVGVQKIVSENKFTKPPPRYNPGTLLKRMEHENIGTKATRANIIETLHERKYTRGEKIVVTDLGFEVTNVLRKYCPQIMSVEFTQNLENKMDEVLRGKENKENLLSEAIGILKTVTTSLKDNERAVGEQLSRSVSRSKLEERVIGECPGCKSGKLIIQYSKKTGKRFVGCTNYFQGTCKTSFSLPQKGSVKPSSKECKDCGWLTLHVRLSNNHLWNLCLNPDCATKERRKKR